MRGISMVAAAWVCIAGLVYGENTKDVLLLRGPNIDKKLAEDCFNFMKKNVRGTLRTDRTLLSVEWFKPQEQLKIFSAMRSGQDKVVLVLVNDPASTNSVVMYSRSLAAAVVNVAPIMNDGSFPEKIRRAMVDRAAMYALGRTIGMDACLNPYCALSEYRLVQKDKMPGRNYCPNCVDKVADKLKALGIVEVAEKQKSVPQKKKQ